METHKVEIKKTEIKRMEPDLKLINMETVEVEQIEWLFYPFIPFGKVTIIQGDPGEGKTTMVLQIIAKLTKGEEILPRQENTAEVKDGAETVADSDVKLSESPIEPVNVIYQTAEDGLGDTIKPRLLAAGADCSRVLVIDDREQPLTMLDIPAGGSYCTDQSPSGGIRPNTGFPIKLNHFLIWWLQFQLSSQIIITILDQRLEHILD